MMYEFKKYLPNCEIKGIDTSRYCKILTKREIKKYINIETCEKLSQPDKYFDFVVSISTIYNVAKNCIKKSLKEIVRVGKKYSFIRVKAYNTLTEKKKIDEWNIIAKSNFNKKTWLKFFKKQNILEITHFQTFSIIMLIITK